MVGEAAQPVTFLSLFISPRADRPHLPHQIPLLLPMKTEGFVAPPHVRPTARKPAQMLARAGGQGLSEIRVSSFSPSTCVGRGLKGIVNSCRHVALGELEHQWDPETLARGEI